MKKYIIELIGTFFLTLVIALSGNALAIGAVLISLVYVGGKISGGHYNPAVTLAVFLRKKLETKDALFFFLAQFLGALLALLTYAAITHEAFSPTPDPEYIFVSIFFIETLFTFALAFTVLVVATSEKTKGNQYFGLAIGFILMASIFAGAKISGGVYNPAVTLSSFLVGLPQMKMSFLDFVTYIIGQFAGGALAAITYIQLNKPEISQTNNPVKPPKEINKVQNVTSSLIRSLTI